MLAIVVTEVLESTHGCRCTLHIGVIYHDVTWGGRSGEEEEGRRGGGGVGRRGGGEGRMKRGGKTGGEEMDK